MAMAFYQLGVMAIEDLFLTQVCTNLCHIINLCVTSASNVSHHFSYVTSSSQMSGLPKSYTLNPEP